jgi:hypothetical protein
LLLVCSRTRPSGQAGSCAVNRRIGCMGTRAGPSPRAGPGAQGIRAPRCAHMAHAAPQPTFTESRRRVLLCGFPLGKTHQGGGVPPPKQGSVVLSSELAPRSSFSRKST